MRPGDMVIYRFPFMANAPDFDTQEPGLVLSVDQWADSGAPDRNYGITVKVRWAFSGTIAKYEEDELEIISFASRDE